MESSVKTLAKPLLWGVLTGLKEVGMKERGKLRSIQPLRGHNHCAIFKLVLRYFILNGFRIKGDVLWSVIILTIGIWWAYGEAVWATPDGNPIFSQPWIYQLAVNLSAMWALHRKILSMALFPLRLMALNPITPCLHLTQHFLTSSPQARYRWMSCLILTSRKFYNLLKSWHF